MTKKLEKRSFGGVYTERSECAQDDKRAVRDIFIGMAWPYANGSLHLGHIAALLPADILARYHRLKGDRVLFVSGTDCHGTPIAVKARELGIEPAEIAARYHQEFAANFQQLGFDFDYYGHTSDPRHYALVQKIFLELYEKGLIYKKEELLTYCPQCQEFLPDRYVEGTCPHCGFTHARGDQCDQCGALLDPHELIDAKCKTCGATPIQKPAEHFFLKLSAFEAQLKEWVAGQTTWRANALKFTQNLLEQGLHDRAITRDLEWGVPVPIEGYESKKIYVWFEAVCGYYTDSIFWGEEQGKKAGQKEIPSAEFTLSEANVLRASLHSVQDDNGDGGNDKGEGGNDNATEQIWWNNPQAWHYYVHGKDNIPFHTVIWPAILLGLGKNLPNQIVSSEYLTLEEQKISTSRKWAVWLPDYLERYQPEALRYYLVSNGPETRDADFSWDKFIERNNKELVGTYGNLVNRLLNLAVKNFDGVLPESPLEPEVEAKIQATFAAASALIEKAELREALRVIFDLATFGNQYLDQRAPWKAMAEDRQGAANTLFQALQVVGALAILLEPFLPFSSAKIFDILGWTRADLKWEFQPVKPQKPLALGEILFPKLDPKTAEEEKARLGTQA